MDRRSLERLLAAGVSPDVRDEWGRSALAIVVGNGDRMTAMLLLKKGASIAKAEWDSQPVMHVVARSGKPSMAALLMRFGARLRRQHLLHATALNDNLAMMRFLIKHGVALHERDEEGKTALHQHFMLGSEKTARFLLEQGAKVGAKDKAGDTPLHDVARFYVPAAHAAIIRLAKRWGARFDMKNRKGKKPADLVRDPKHRPDFMNI
jgi:ankyrin repeat protein